ncbi:MAG: hypothetical protein KKE05_05825, partial [Nanoarchaeota archaeon]|nr:hypothetical protein [Nanoarchaeota archaeon]
LYNLKRTIKTSNEKEIQLFLFFKIEMVSFGTTPKERLKTKEPCLLNGRGRKRQKQTKRK